MQTNKKKIMYITAVVILIIAAVIGTIFAIKTINNPSGKEKTAITKESADNIKAQAIEALNNKDTAKAKTLFKEAKQQYDEVGDKNGSVDAEAQIFLIEHPSTN